MMHNIMNIENMTDERKSVMLAKLCGWQYRQRGIIGNSWWSNGDQFYDECHNGTSVTPLNLYDPANMALAWRVLNWAIKPDATLCNRVHRFFLFSDLDLMPPDEAQRLWLDKVLSLAIEAGVVEEET